MYERLTFKTESEQQLWLNSFTKKAAEGKGGYRSKTLKLKNKIITIYKSSLKVYSVIPNVNNVIIIGVFNGLDYSNTPEYGGIEISDTINMERFIKRNIKDA